MIFFWLSRGFKTLICLAVKVGLRRFVRRIHAKFSRKTFARYPIVLSAEE